MSTPTECASHSTHAEDSDCVYLNRGKVCFACDRVDSRPHPREWVSYPGGPERKQRTLVLCFDGTGDSFDKDNTNVVQFMAMLMKDDPTKQLVYYQAGIGTYTNNVNKTAAIETMTKLRDKMFAHSLSDHIKEGYKFLMQTYRSGDKICIFGFSRGAYTARALAGMLQKVGLLPQCNVEQVPFAYAVYESRDKDDIQMSRRFKQTFSIDVRIEFLGVWDTVGSVGWDSEDLPFCGSNSAIAHFRHAVALDERRVKFAPTYYGTKTPKDEDPEDERDRPVQESKKVAKNLYVHATDAKEVFFAGVHCDVGGGSVKNGERYSLARIPLRWMIRECFDAKTGILFDAHMLKYETGLDIGPGPTFAAPQSLLPTTHKLAKKPEGPSWMSSAFSWIQAKVSSPPKTASDDNDDKKPVIPIGDESQEELNDALSRIYDQLEEHSYWRAMEQIPVIGKRCTDLVSSEGSWTSMIGSSNGGKGRTVEPGIKVHRSVKARILAGDLEGKGDQYLPHIRVIIDGKAQCLKREEWLEEKPTHFEWVD